ncbi:MAG TPA: hypothetical protein VGS41_17560 [Chthonomonadales bacterium]|nr:hypothetical protein [Chthonomonadales bacterium]
MIRPAIPAACGLAALAGAVALMVRTGRSKAHERPAGGSVEYIQNTPEFR